MPGHEAGRNISKALAGNQKKCLFRAAAVFGEWRHLPFYKKSRRLHDKITNRVGRMGAGFISKHLKHSGGKPHG